MITASVDCWFNLQMTAVPHSQRGLRLLPVADGQQLVSDLTGECVRVPYECSLKFSDLGWAYLELHRSEGKQLAWLSQSKLLQKALWPIDCYCLAFK